MRERDLARERHGPGQVGHGGLLPELPPEKMVDIMVRRLAVYKGGGRDGEVSGLLSLFFFFFLS